MVPGRNLVCHTPGNSITSPSGFRDARNFREHRIDRRFLGSAGGFVQVIYNENDLRQIPEQPLPAPYATFIFITVCSFAGQLSQSAEGDLIPPVAASS